MKKQKPKKCKYSKCKKEFMPWSTTQTTCNNPTCAFGYTAEKRAKKEAKKLAGDRAVFKLNDKKVQRVLAQKAFNRFIRMRDAKLPCISCGTTNDVIYCAGHYRSRGAIATLSFEELNVHKQCNKHCNLEKSGNVGEYRIALIKKIGLEKLEWLEGPHEPVKYSAEDYVAIKKKYLRKCQEMEK